jgi:hypothetical protein
MSVRITSDEDKAALFDSVSGWAFGPVFDNSDEADDFLVFCESAELPDVRTMTENDLADAHEKWAADRMQANTPEPFDMSGATPGVER